MKRRTVITLFEKTVSTSETGFETRNAQRGREVFAEQGGVGRTEFYKAAAVGMAPAVTFTVSEADYRGEKLIGYEGKRFRVIRTYPIASRKMELVCEGEAPNDD